MVGQKKFSPSSFGAAGGSGIRDLVSGMDKTQEPGSGVKKSQIRNTGASVRKIFRVTLSWVRST
jgi:hypothetical protein